VWLEDCSEWLLHVALQEYYKGSGGPAENASSMRLHTIWDYGSKHIGHFTPVDRRTTDSALANVILDYIEPGDLVIRDLGFYAVKSMEAIAAKGAYFLSRLRSGTSVFKSSECTEPLDLANYLESHVTNTQSCDVDVCVFNARLAVRLVAFKAKRSEYRRREKEYLKQCRRLQRTPNEDTMRLMRFTIYITNVDRTVWSPSAVEIAYRIRWQIELLFKCWKSQLCLHVFKGTNIHRIRCLLYAKLIGVTIIQVTHSALQHYAEHSLDKDISLPKLVGWLQREGRIAQAIRSGFSDRLWKMLIGQVGRLLCKEDNRRRQTTQQRADNMQRAA
jgi:hypothetical protein